MVAKKSGRFSGGAHTEFFIFFATFMLVSLEQDPSQSQSCEKNHPKTPSMLKFTKQQKTMENEALEPMFNQVYMDSSHYGGAPAEPALFCSNSQQNHGFLCTLKLLKSRF